MAELTMLASWKELRMAECILLKVIPPIAAGSGVIRWDILRFFVMVYWNIKMPPIRAASYMRIID